MSDRYVIGELSSAEGIDLMVYDTAICWRTMAGRSAGGNVPLTKRRLWIELREGVAALEAAA